MVTRSTTTRRPSRVRQADVAKAAGVSQATVSLVLSDAPLAPGRVSARTREQVLRTAGDLGYSVDPVARNLVGALNRLLGVYTFESVFPIESRDFYQDLLVGIQYAAEEADYDLLVFTSATAPSHRGIYAAGMNRLALSDGGILLGRHSNRDEIRRLSAEQFPFVYVGRRDISDARIWYVTADYRAATRGVVDHLIGLGHERIGYLGLADPDEPDVDRAAGWHDREGALAEAVEVRPPAIEPQVLHRLVHDRGVTAIVVENAESAESVFDSAASAGIGVPDDLSVAVLGDLPVRSLDHQLWTGFTTPRREMGKEAVKMLLRRLGSQPDATPQVHQVACGFEPGSTCGRPTDGDRQVVRR
jgi:DNA-binding LacI/PurR family transcriptional regulator